MVNGMGRFCGGTMTPKKYFRVDHSSLVDGLWGVLSGKLPAELPAILSGDLDGGQTRSVLSSLWTSLESEDSYDDA